MERRTLIIIIVAVIAVLVVGGGVWYWWSRPAEPSATDTTVTQPPVTNRLVIDGGQSETSPITKDTAPTLTADQQAEVTLERFAFSFVERFGSYSSSSDFSNLVDLKGFMTDSLKRWVDDLVANARPSDDLPWGITTKALSLESAAAEGGITTMIIATQRIENRIGQTGPKIYKQTVELKVIESGQKWLVDSVTWQ